MRDAYQGQLDALAVNLAGMCDLVAEALDKATLIGRFYERYADQAVALARRVIYIITGRMPSPVAS